MTDFSCPGASSFEHVPLSSYVDKRPTSALSPSPRKKPGSTIQSHGLLNGRHAPRNNGTLSRRESKETDPSAVTDTNAVPEEPQPTLFPVVPIEHEISEKKWLENQLFYRKLVSGVWTGVAAYVIFLGAFLALQFSIWTPFKTASKIIWGSFSLKLHAVAFMAGTALGVVSFFLGVLLPGLDQQKCASLAKYETWTALLMNITFYLVTFSTAFGFFFNYSAVANKGVFHFIFVVGTVIASTVNVFNHDYQLIFGGLKLKNVFKNTFYSLIVHNISLSARQSFYQGIKVLACASILSFFLVPLVHGFSGWTFLFNLSGHYALVVIFTAEILIGHVFHRILRQKVLEPMHFPFPPPYAIANPSSQQKRNICALLQSNEPLLKLFALFDVRFIAWYDHVRREEVFALSQPAGHPRNWKSIFNLCHQILDSMRVKVDAARNKLAGIDNNKSENLDSDEEEYVNRNMLLMPPSAREQLYSARSRNRHQSVLKPQYKAVTVERKTLAEYVSKWTKFTEETGLITRLEMEMAILAVEALDMLILHSLSQDRYGVLQKDLSTIMKDILSLYTSIDRYLRIKGFTQAPVDNEGFLRLVEDVLVSTMTRIGEKFSNNIRCFGYTAQEVRQFETIISQSSLNA